MASAVVKERCSECQVADSAPGIPNDIRLNSEEYSVVVKLKKAREHERYVIVAKG